MKTFVSLAFVLFFLSGCQQKKPPIQPVNEQIEPANQSISHKTALEIDPLVRIGKLDNGLTYFVQKNSKPEQRVELRLAVNAGSILEDEDQRGLAHFIEHMAFNGTRNFKKQEMIDYLESIGMQFGSDLNAYTSFEETVYMLQVPTDDDAKLDKAFQILADWAQGVSFVPEEIEKERGVVLEEWRLGRGASGRIQDKQFPLMYQGSKYAERLPIGKPEIIQTAPLEAFTRFYETWYRPDLMGVVAVGDLEPDVMEAKIKQFFQGLTNPEPEKPRPSFEIPDHPGTLFSAETDPEMTRSVVQIMYKKEMEEILFQEDLPRAFTKMIYGMIINDRLQERTKEAVPPFLMAYSGFSSMGRNKGVFSQVALVNEGEFEKGIHALLEESQRIKQHGFTASELDRAKTQMIRQYENRLIESDKIQSSSHSGQYVSYFLSGGKSIISSDKSMLEYAKSYLPGISLEDLKALTLETMTPDNRVVLLSGPEKEGLHLPSQSDVDTWIDSVNEQKMTAYEDNVVDGPLVEVMKEPGQILKIEYNQDKDITFWELDNGIRVFLKPTDFYNDDISFTSYSPGGTSLVPDDSLIHAEIASELISNSGYGIFSQTQLEKRLAGKLAYAYPYISSLFEGVSGSCSAKDQEVMFQLIYLKLTQPRVDLEIFDSMKNKKLEYIRNRMANPSSYFFDQYYKVLYNNNPRNRPLSEEDIKAFDPDKALAFYRDRFADFSDFTFVFVGNFTPESFKPLVQKYLGALPCIHRKETWVDNQMNPVRGIVPVTVYKGLEPQSTVYIQFTGSAIWTPEQVMATQSLSKVLRIRLREILREDKGGVYGVNVGTSVSRWPQEQFNSTISFGCSPENVDSLIESAFDEIKKIQKEGIEESVLVKVRESFLKQRETALKENSFWLNTISTYDKYQLDLKRLDAFEDRVHAIDSQMVQDAAITYFDFSNMVIGKLYPEVHEEKEPLPGKN